MGKKHLYLIALVAWVCLCCNANRPKPEEVGLVTPAREKAKAILLSATQKQTLHDEPYLMNRLLVADHVIKLREPKDYLIGEVTQLAFSDDRMFILDKMQKMVYRYHLDGRFDGLMGRFGGGPGEYYDPISIDTIWGDQLAVWDNVGKLDVFGFDGEYRFSLRQNQGDIVPRGPFFWKEKSRLYAYSPLAEGLAPNLIQIVDYSILEKPVVVGGFETKYPFLDKFGFDLGLTAFARVGEHFWVGNPYEGDINVFDSEGKKVKEIVLASADLEALDFEYLEEIGRKHGNSRAFSKALMERERASYFSVVGPVVLVFSRSLQLYSHDGERLTRRFPISMPAPLGNFQDMAVTQLETFTREEGEDIYRTSMKREYDMMVALGFNMDEESDDIYLCFRKLVE